MCPPQHIWKLVEILQIHPDLANNFTHLRLGSWTKTAQDAISEHQRNLTEQQWGDCLDILGRTYPRLDNFSRINMSDIDGFLSAGLAYLVALCPRLKMMSLGLNWVRLNPLIDKCFRNNGLAAPPPIQGWHEQVQTQLQARLVNLEIWEEDPLVRVDPSKKVPWPTAYITVLNFAQLKRLLVPYSRITQEPKDRRGVDAPRNRGLSGPLSVLPGCLEYLCVYYSQWSLSPAPAWLDNLLECPPSRLRHLELRYESNLQTTAWDFCIIRCGQSFISAMKRWKGGSAVTIVTTFGSWTNQVQHPTPKVRQRSVYEEGDLVTEIESRLAATFSGVR